MRVLCARPARRARADRQHGPEARRRRAASTASTDGVYSLVPPQAAHPRGALDGGGARLRAGRGPLASHCRGAPRPQAERPARTSRSRFPADRGAIARGIDVHRSTTLVAADVTVVNNIPCTSVARTLFDLAEVVNRRALERAFDQAEILEVFDLRALEDQLEPQSALARARRASGRCSTSTTSAARRPRASSRRCSCRSSAGSGCRPPRSARGSTSATASR